MTILSTKTCLCISKIISWIISLIIMASCNTIMCMISIETRWTRSSTSSCQIICISNYTNLYTLICLMICIFRTRRFTYLSNIWFRSGSCLTILHAFWIISIPSIWTNCNTITRVWICKCTIYAWINTFSCFIISISSRITWSRQNAIIIRIRKISLWAKLNTSIIILK